MRAKLVVSAVAVVAGFALATASAAGERPENAGIVWADLVRGIYGANVDGSGVHLIVAPVADAHSGPAWSPSGRILAFSGRDSDTGALYLHRRGVERNRVVYSDFRSPRHARSFGQLYAPSWAPDEKHLTVVDAWNPVNATIKVVQLPGGRLRPLTRPSWYYVDGPAAWSPDGGEIAFVRRHVAPGRSSTGHDEPPMIYLVRPDGSGFHRLTSGTSPSWSPDSRQLVFAWGDALYRIDAIGRNRARVTRGLGGLALEPSW
jgi:Tol biopolymer transport system component